MNLTQLVAERLRPQDRQQYEWIQIREAVGAYCAGKVGNEAKEYVGHFDVKFGAFGLGLNN